MYSIMSGVYVKYIDPIRVINVFEYFAGSGPTTDDCPHSIVYGCFGSVDLVFSDMVDIPRSWIGTRRHKYCNDISMVIRDKPGHKGASIKQVYQDHL